MTYYEILEISPNASQDVIRAAYKAMCKKYHPDNTQDDGEDEEIKKINEAYSVLIDPATREEYDRKLADDAHAKAQETSKDDNRKEQPDIAVVYERSTANSDEEIAEEVGIGRKFINLLLWIWGGFWIMCGWAEWEESQTAAVMLICSGIIVLPVATGMIPRFRHKKKIIAFLSIFLICKGTMALPDSGNTSAQKIDSTGQIAEKKEATDEPSSKKEEADTTEDTAANKILSDVKEAAGDFLDGVASGDLSVAGFGGHPRGFTVKTKACALGETTLDDIRNTYGIVLEQENILLTDVDGYIMFAADSSGKVNAVVTQSKKMKGYKGIKIGMKKKAMEKKLGTPSSEDDDMDFWYYTSEGKLLSGDGYDEDIAIVQAEYIIGASFKGRLFGNGEAEEIFIMDKDEYLDGILGGMEELEGGWD